MHARPLGRPQPQRQRSYAGGQVRRGLSRPARPARATLAKRCQGGYRPAAVSWNLPNTLTLVRLMLLPSVVALVWPGIACRATALGASLVYLLAGVLDVVDGAIARYTRQVTALGQFLDPLADKLFYLITLVALMQAPGAWVAPWVVMVCLARELAVTGLRGIAISQGVTIAAGGGGKAKTTFATAGVCSLLVHYSYAVHLGFVSVVVNAQRVGMVFTYISVAFSLLSAAGYLRGFLRAANARARLEALC